MSEIAKHFSEGKSPLQFIDPKFLIDMGKVHEMGEKKYGRANWMKGVEFESFIGSALRHLEAFSAGEDIDQESGLPHLVHVALNCEMIEHSRRNQIGIDNRRFKNLK